MPGQKPLVLFASTGGFAFGGMIPQQRIDAMGEFAELLPQLDSLQSLFDREVFFVPSSFAAALAKPHRVHKGFRFEMRNLAEDQA